MRCYGVSPPEICLFIHSLVYFQDSDNEWLAAVAAFSAKSGTLAQAESATENARYVRTHTGRHAHTHTNLLVSYIVFISIIQCLLVSYRVFVSIIQCLLVSYSVC